MHRMSAGCYRNSLEVIEKECNWVQHLAQLQYLRKMDTKFLQVLLKREMIYEVQTVKHESERTWGLRPVPQLPILRAGLPQVPNPEVGRQRERWALLTVVRTPVARHRSPGVVSLLGWHWR